MNHGPAGLTIGQEPRLVHVTTDVALEERARVKESTDLARVGVRILARPDKGMSVPEMPAEAGAMIADLFHAMTNRPRGVVQGEMSAADAMAPLKTVAIATATDVETETIDVFFEVDASPVPDRDILARCKGTLTSDVHAPVLHGEETCIDCDDHISGIDSLASTQGVQLGHVAVGEAVDCVGRALTVVVNGLILIRPGWEELNHSPSNWMAPRST